LVSDASISLGLAAAVVMLAFAGNYLSKKTKIPDTLILIFVGFLIGPIFGIFNEASISAAAPIIITFSVTVIAFNGGLTTNLFHAAQESPRALKLTMLTMIATLFFLTLFIYFFLGWPLFESLLLASVLGGSGPPIVLGFFTRASVPARVNTILSIESAFSDVVTIAIATAMLMVYTTSSISGTEEAVRLIVGGLTSGGVLGFGAGIVWLRLLKNKVTGSNRDILTLFAAFGIFSISELSGGNGAISVLIFGLILGNGKSISRILRMGWASQVDAASWRFHGQISFMVKAFLFVYLGMSTSLIQPDVLIFAIILTIILLIIRYLSVFITSLNEPLLSLDRGLLAIIFPRGFATGVLSQVIAHSGIPEGNVFSDIAVYVLIISITVSSFGTHITKVKPPKFIVDRGSKVTKKISKKKNNVQNNHHLPILHQREGEYVELYEFKKILLRALLNDEFKEEWSSKPKSIRLTINPKLPNLAPDFFIQTKSSQIVIEATPLTPYGGIINKEILIELHRMISMYKKIGYKNEVRFVFDSISVLKNLKIFRNIQEYYNRTKKDRQFTVTLYLLDPKKEKITPVSNLLKLVHQ